MQRHKQAHLSQSLVKAHDAKEVLRPDNVLDQVKKLAQRSEKLYLEAESVLQDARRSKDLRTAVAAIGQANRVLSEARANATLLGELTQQYQPAPVLRNQIDLRMLFAVPKLVPSHQVIQLDTEEFPDLSEEEDGLYQGSAGRGRGHDLRISARAARRLDLGHDGVHVACLKAMNDRIKYNAGREPP